MMLASPVFNAMLKRGFKEGEELRADGKVEIPLPDDDEFAFHDSPGRCPWKESAHSPPSRIQVFGDSSYSNRQISNARAIIRLCGVLGTLLEKPFA